MSILIPFIWHLISSFLYLFYINVLWYVHSYIYIDGSEGATCTGGNTLYIYTRNIIGRRRGLSRVGFLFTRRRSTVRLSGQGGAGCFINEDSILIKSDEKLLT